MIGVTHHVNPYTLWKTPRCHSILRVVANEMVTTKWWHH
jgi:hypothetical protein